MKTFLPPLTYSACIIPPSYFFVGWYSLAKTAQISSLERIKVKVVSRLNTSDSSLVLRFGLGFDNSQNENISLKKRLERKSVHYDAWLRIVNTQGVTIAGITYLVHSKYLHTYYSHLYTQYFTIHTYRLTHRIGGVGCSTALMIWMITGHQIKQWKVGMMACLTMLKF